MAQNFEGVGGCGVSLGSLLPQTHPSTPHKPTSLPHTLSGQGTIKLVKTWVGVGYRSQKLLTLQFSTADERYLYYIAYRKNIIHTIKLREDNHWKQLLLITQLSDWWRVWMRVWGPYPPTHSHNTQLRRSGRSSFIALIGRMRFVYWSGLTTTNDEKEKVCVILPWRYQYGSVRLYFPNGRWLEEVGKRNRPHVCAQRTYFFCNKSINSVVRIAVVVFR
jgi:hypothetical protein